MKSKNIIELNGKHYDAVTGSVLGVAAPTAQKPAAGKNMDGFFRAPRSASVTPTPTVQKVSVVAAPAPAPKSSGKPARNLNHARAHKPEAPKTLMRTAVKHPSASFKQQTNVQGSLQHKVPSLIVAKQSISSVDPQRLSRATSIERSPHIARHHSQVTQPVAVNFVPLAVKVAPDKPDEAETPGAPAPQPSNKPLDMFEHALVNAGHFVDTQARKADLKKHARQHFTSMAAGTLALLVIAGFAAYQNTPGLQFKVASLQAGVATHMPNFQAAGFAYNGVRAEDGKLTIGFSGHGGKYQLTQQATNWSDTDMIQNVSSTDASGTPDYSTVDVQGTDVYKFSNNTATWVSDGKWYQLTGTGALSNDQVKSLVANI